MKPLSEQDDFHMTQFKLLLSRGSDLEIDPDQEYLFKWELDENIHQTIMATLKVILDDEFVNLVVGDAIAFYDQLKNAPVIQRKVHKDVIVSGLAITALSMILYEIWSNEQLIKDKTELNKFIHGLYTNIEPVDNKSLE